jgi:endonuclease V-like protein UPF0215 family
MTAPLSNVIGFDDAPFDRDHRGNIALIGTVCSRTRLDGVLKGFVRRDGANATRRMIEMIEGSRWREHIQAVFLQGIAVAGFNVVDMHRLARALDVPVVAVARRLPDFPGVKKALRRTGPGWERKWRLIERAGAMEPVRGVYIQRAGLGVAEAQHLLAATTLHGKLPEALRLAHLIAGGTTTGQSRGRA